MSSYEAWAAMAKAVEQMPILSSGHTGNLHIETEDRRVWVERAWRDYDCRPVTVERLIDGCWVDVTEGEGDE